MAMKWEPEVLTCARAVNEQPKSMAEKNKDIQVPQVQGTADIFRGFMVSLYVKGKENGHVQAYAPTGAMGLKRWGGLTSKLDGLPVASDPHLWWQACP